MEPDGLHPRIVTVILNFMGVAWRDVHTAWLCLRLP